VSFVADFARISARLAEVAPPDRDAVRAWALAELGSETPSGGAAGLACDWYIAGLADARPRHYPRASSRVTSITASRLYAEAAPEAKKVIVELGAGLWAEGALAGPYDERSILDDPDEPLGNGEPGPARLLALMTLSAYAHDLGHPSAAAWTAAARAGIPTVPTSIFYERIRTLWAGVGEPEEAAEQPEHEMPIWVDDDVRAIYASKEAGGIELRRDQGRHRRRPGSRRDDQSVPGGSRRLRGPIRRHADRLAQVARVRRLGPDLWLVGKVSSRARIGRARSLDPRDHRIQRLGSRRPTTPLGQHHSYAMGVANESGFPFVVINPATRRAEAATGAAARRAAANGRDHSSRECLTAVHGPANDGSRRHRCRRDGDR
jgi:hypothetical protein